MPRIRFAISLFVLGFVFSFQALFLTQKLALPFAEADLFFGNCCFGRGFAKRQLVKREDINIKAHQCFPCKCNLTPRQQGALNNTNHSLKTKSWLGNGFHTLLNKTEQVQGYMRLREGSQTQQTWVKSPRELCRKKKIKGMKNNLIK